MPVWFHRSRSTAISFSSGDSQLLTFVSEYCSYLRQLITYAVTGLSARKKYIKKPQAEENAPIIINWYLQVSRLPPWMWPIPYARRPPKELARPKNVDQYPIRIGCSSTLYHIAVKRRYAGVEQDSSIPRTNLKPASAEKLLQPPRAMQIPPQMKIFADSHLETDTLCMAKLVGY